MRGWHGEESVFEIASGTFLSVLPYELAAPSPQLSLVCATRSPLLPDGSATRSPLLTSAMLLPGAIRELRLCLLAKMLYRWRLECVIIADRSSQDDRPSSRAGDSSLVLERRPQMVGQLQRSDHSEKRHGIHHDRSADFNRGSCVGDRPSACTHQHQHPTNPFLDDVKMV